MSLSYMTGPEEATYELLVATESCLSGEEISAPVLDYLARTDVLGRVGLESFGMENDTDTETLRRHASAALAAHAAKFDHQISTADEEVDSTSESIWDKLSDPSAKLLIPTAALSAVVGLIATGVELTRVIANDVLVKKEAAAMKAAAEKIAELKTKLPHLEMRSNVQIKIDETAKAAITKAKTLIKWGLTKMKLLKPKLPEAAPELKLPTTAWGRAGIGRRTLALSLTFAAYTALAFIVTRILLAAYRWINKQIVRKWSVDGEKE